MLKKLIKRVTNNLGLKVMALLSAVILWVVVINLDDPTITAPFTVSVKMKNEEAITEMNKYYEIVDGKNAVDFRVSAKRSVLKLLNSTDFQATADLSKIEKNDESWRVPIEIEATRSASSVRIVSKTQYLHFNVEDLQAKPVVIKPEYVGTPAENYAVGAVEALPNVVNISGPASLVSQIADTATATIDVTGASVTLSENVVPKFYDIDGNLIEDTSRLNKNVETVSITAKILDVKTIEISANVTGTPADGYVNTGITYSPQTVDIKGSAATLNTLNVITIPDGIVDMEGATETFSITVDFSTYLPNGVTLVGELEKKVDITVTIEKIEDVAWEIPTDNILLKDLAKGYLVEFDNESISLPIRGLSSNIEKLTAEDITVTVDLNGLKAGEHTVALIITLDDAIYSTDADQMVTLTIIKKEEDDSGNTDDNTNNNSKNNNKNNNKNNTKNQDDATNKVDENSTEQ